jgi:hypothetical protein
MIEQEITVSNLQRFDSVLKVLKKYPSFERSYLNFEWMTVNFCFIFDALSETIPKWDPRAHCCCCQYWRCCYHSHEHWPH